MCATGAVDGGTAAEVQSSRVEVGAREREREREEKRERRGMRHVERRLVLRGVPTIWAFVVGWGLL